MTPNYFVTSEELKAIKRRAQSERVKYLARVAKALVATMKALVSGTVPGGFHAAH
jgi:hypothetical protein